MSKKRKPKGAIWAYLEDSGILENGTEEEIKAAKKAYRKDYFLKYKRDHRSNNPEFTINLSRKTGEHSRIKHAAERHKMTVTAFIRSAALSYLDRQYLVPNESQIALLEQILSQCLNEIQRIVGVRERYHWERDQKFEEIEKKIEKLELEIDSVFRNPPLITHDRQNQVFQKAGIQETS